MARFELNDKEKKKAEAFIKKHKHPEVSKGAIGGHINYVFTPTGIGICIWMECSICKAKKDITDYNCW